MGIYDRDYYREGSNSFLDSWGRQGVTIWLIVITVGVFLAQCVTGRPIESPLVEFGAYDHTLILEGQVWRLVTPLFLHAGLFHLFCNMLILYWTGTRLEERYGRGEFLAFYLIAGVFANVVYLVVYLFGGAPNPAVGASGAVTAVLVLFACHYPRQQVLLFFVIPMPMWVLVALYVTLDTLGALGGRGQGIAFVVHLGGAAFGGLYYLSTFRFTDLLPGRSRRASGTRVRLRVAPVHPEVDAHTPVGAAVENAPRPREANEAPEAEPTEFEKRVDQVLAKVSQYGQESLTPEEREILFKASELYKKRRK